MNEYENSFKLYDLRGRYPSEIDENLAYRIGLAFAQVLNAESVAVGRDMRLSGESLCEALKRGLSEAGCNVHDVGLCGTEEIYHATFSNGYDGGIVVTASHNPADYNGMKMVMKDARPVTAETGLNEIRELVLGDELESPGLSGSIREESNRDSYVDHILGYVDVEAIKPLKVVANAGNGCAGLIVDELEERLPVEFIKIHNEPDGTFPNGVPNPLLQDRRDATRQAVLDADADLGLAWDGDFDRCFFFDEKGDFVEGYYVVGLLAEAILKTNPGAKIIHDPRLVWNTEDVVEKAGGVPVMCPTGHAIIKERMRAEDAVYGGEMSAHHYFRDFAYCDSGMITALLVLDLMSTSGKPLSEMVAAYRKAYPVSGEINRRLADAKGAIKAVEESFAGKALTVEYVDGVSMDMGDWRFNLRSSNTEPVVRLNVESRGDVALMRKQRDEILGILDRFA